MDIILEPLKTGGRRRRTYSAELKAEIVAACKQPGVSAAFVALQYDVNPNVMHRWVKESDPTWVPRVNSSQWVPRADKPAFVPIEIGTSAPRGRDCVKFEIRKGEAIVTVEWPLAQILQSSAFFVELLR